MADNNFEKTNAPQFLASLPRPQKIAVLALSLLAILIVFFWAWQFKASLNRPFKLATPENSGSAYLDPREQDSDHDGLSDYDELNVFKTSPYLEDTDSDGLTDKQETDQGLDPNCPAGRNCNVVTETPNTNTSNPPVSPVVEQPIPNLSLPTDLDSAGLSEESLQEALSGQMSVAELRQLLVDAGGDKAMLDQLSDADLMAIYQESLQSQDTQ